jgi:hypothetical protein
MRVDEPMLSMVATEGRKALRSHASKSLPRALELIPFGNEIKTSGLFWMAFARIIAPNNAPNYTH